MYAISCLLARLQAPGQHHAECYLDNTVPCVVFPAMLSVTLHRVCYSGVFRMCTPVTHEHILLSGWQSQGAIALLLLLLDLLLLLLLLAASNLLGCCTINAARSSHTVAHRVLPAALATAVALL